MQTLSGVLASFDNAMVVHKDVSYFGPVRRELIELTVQYGRLNVVEVTVGGYDDDPRAVYEVPEVRRWVKEIKTRWPDFLLWLTPGSLWVFALCINPEMHTRLPDGRHRIEFQTDALFAQVAESQMEGGKTLKKAGMTKSAIARVMEESRQNVAQMLECKKWGDYSLIHPADGKVRLYRTDASS
jgi:hypothetical protein